MDFPPKLYPSAPDSSDDTWVRGWRQFVNFVQFPLEPPKALYKCSKSQEIHLKWCTIFLSGTGKVYICTKFDKLIQGFEPTTKNYRRSLWSMGLWKCEALTDRRSPFSSLFTCIVRSGCGERGEMNELVSNHSLGNEKKGGRSWRLEHKYS